MYKIWINNEWHDRPQTARVMDPASGELVDEIALGTANDVDVAAQSAVAAAAQATWRENPIRRAQWLWEWAARIEASRETLATLLTRENGKVIGEAHREIMATVDTLRFAAGQARQLEGRALTLGPGLYSDVIPEPLGVVGFIIPWNWPVLLLMRELAPALAAGNAAIIKPSLLAPLTVTALFQCLPSADDLPSGLLNVIPGKGSVVGEALVQHPDVRAISFTGSTETGQHIARAAAEQIKKVLLELGGKSASIVFPDAPLAKMIPTLVQGMYGSTGQNCMAAARILVHEDIYAQVREKLVEAIQKIRVGPGLDPASTMGPLISQAQLQISQGFVKSAVQDGGHILTGGHRLEGALWDRGHFYAPTLIEEVVPDSPLIHQEIFGPVVSLERFSTEAEAITMANATHYGLVSSLWTQDHARAMRLSRQLASGTVWINSYQRTFAEAESGGTKFSGLGRSRGKMGLYEYTELKHVFTDTN